MKFSGSTRNVFPFDIVLPQAGQWENGSARRARYTIRPLNLDDMLSTAGQRDELAHKQETICAVILGLCLICTVIICFWQLGSL